MSVSIGIVDNGFSLNGVFSDFQVDEDLTCFIIGLGRENREFERGE